MSYTERLGPNTFRDEINSPVALESERLMDEMAGATMRQPADEVTRIYQEAVGEGWGFDGLTLDEFKALPADQQRRAIAGYQNKDILH